MTKSKNSKKEKSNTKYIIISVVVVVLAIFVWFSVADNSADTTQTAPKAETELPLGNVTFLKPDTGKDITILVEIAEDEYSRAKGLMYRENIPENQGMLFIFEKDDYQSFWMKNTPTALDIIFINSDLEIVTIAKDTKPYNTRSIPSTKPAKYVVEVVSGFTDRNEIKEGDHIKWNRL